MPQDLYKMTAAAFVKTSLGDIQGREIKTRQGRNIAAFFNIPFAKPLDDMLDLLLLDQDMVVNERTIFHCLCELEFMLEPNAALVVVGLYSMPENKQR